MTLVPGGARAWARRELTLCRSELERLQGLPHRPVPVVGAVGASAAIALLGNAVVVAGRHWDAQKEWITLVGVPATGATAAIILCRRGGWTARDLGWQLPKVERPRRFMQGTMAVGIAVAAASGIVGRLSGEDVPVLEVARVLLGTALGEELIHRGVVLGVWASAPVAGRWVVAANMATFALWHVAGAIGASGFQVGEVAGPGALALILLWARLRSRSLAAPAAFHAASNMAQFLPKR